MDVASCANQNRVVAVGGCRAIRQNAVDVNENFEVRSMVKRNRRINLQFITPTFMQLTINKQTCPTSVQSISLWVVILILWWSTLSTIHLSVGHATHGVELSGMVIFN